MAARQQGAKGPLAAEFAACRVRVADGPLMARAQHLPGEAAWLVGERRAGGERKYYLTDHPAKASLRTLACAIKARWSCEQAHQQMKAELGLDHFEGRSWTGLHHHVPLTMIAYGFLQHYRLTHRVLTHRVAPPAARGKNQRATTRPKPPGHPPPPARPRRPSAHLPTRRHTHPAAA